MQGGSINQRWTLTGGDQVIRQLRDIGAAGEKAGADISASTTRTTSVLVGLGNSFGQLGGSIGGAFAGISSTLAGVATGITGVGVAVAAATAGLVAFAKQGAAAAGSVREGAIRVGSSTENYQKLKFAIEQSGGTSEAFERAMGRISEAAEKGGEAAKPFEALGVELKDAAGNARDSTETYRDVADAIAKIENPAQRAAKVIGVFGRRSGAELIESLSLGRRGLREFEDEADRLGIVFDDVAGKVGDDFTDSLAKLGQVAATSGSKVGLAFAPLFLGITEAMSKALGDAQGPILAAANRIADAVKPVFQDIANLISGNTGAVQSQFLLAMKDAAVAVGIAFQAMRVVVGAVLTTLGAGFKFIAETINSVFGTKFTAVDIPLFIIAIKAGAVAIGVLTAAFVALRVATLANGDVPSRVEIGGQASLVEQAMRRWPAVQGRG